MNLVEQNNKLIVKQFEDFKSNLYKSWGGAKVVNELLRDFLFSYLFEKDYVLYLGARFYKSFCGLPMAIEIIMGCRSALDSHIGDESPEKFLQFIKDLFKKEFNIEIDTPV